MKAETDAHLREIKDTAVHEGSISFTEYERESYVKGAEAGFELGAATGELEGILE